MIRNILIFQLFILVIAKADCLTTQERSDLKEKIWQQVEEHSFEIYDFPDHIDETLNNHIRAIRARVRLLSSIFIPIKFSLKT